MTVELHVLVKHGLAAEVTLANPTDPGVPGYSLGGPVGGKNREW